MKKILFLLFGFAIAGIANAQEPITLSDDYKTFGNVEFPGVWVNIPESSLETVQKNWAATISKGTKSKPVIKGQTVSLFGAILPEIYAGPVNVESLLESQQSEVLLFAGIEVKRGELANPGSIEYDKLKSYLKSFAKGQYIEVVKIQVAQEEKNLKAIEKDLSKSRKGNQKLEKKVQSTQSSVAREEDNTLSLRKQLDVANLNFDKISTHLSLATNPDAQKAAKADLKKSQKEKKTILKKVASSENKISKLSSSISDANSSLVANRRSQEDIVEQLNAQKIKVNEFKRKLKTIESW